jgi:structural maintenance of chromosome 3 (chondroitin sulfate proteoglycan 6)
MGIQIESKRNVLEIELNENLRKRKEELRTKLDNISTAAADATGSVEDLDTRRRELKNLGTAIENLRKQETSKDLILAFLYIVLITFPPY